MHRIPASLALVPGPLALTGLTACGDDKDGGGPRRARRGPQLLAQHDGPFACGP